MKKNISPIVHLEQLDNILTRIYADGNNQATFVEIFNPFAEDGITPPIEVFYSNEYDPEMEALKYLIEEKYVINVRSNADYNKNLYCLSSKGILKLHSNSFVVEYKKSEYLEKLIKRDYVSNFYMSIGAILLSIIAIIISIFK